MAGEEMEAKYDTVCFKTSFYGLRLKDIIRPKYLRFTNRIFIKYTQMETYMQLKTHLINKQGKLFSIIA